MKSANLRTCSVLLSSTIVGLAMLVTTLDAKAVIILSNLPGSSDYTGDYQFLSTTRWEAIGLQMSSTAMTFSSLEGYFGNSHFVSNYTLEGGIYDDNLGKPGSLLAAFTQVTVPRLTTATHYSLATASAYDLVAATTYWFVVKDVGGLSWYRDTVNTVPTPAPGYTYNGYMITYDSGSTWGADTSGNWTVQIQVVPEPGSVALMLAGAGCLSLCHRSRCKQQ